MKKLERSEYGLAVLDALENNKPEDVIAALRDYLNTKNKTSLAKQTGLHRTSLYLALSDKGNPTVKTLAKLIHAAMYPSKVRAKYD